MQSGGSTAFYEIAATLIPAILLGGLALELFGPGASTPQGKGSISDEAERLGSEQVGQPPPEAKAEGSNGVIIAALAYPTMAGLVVLSEWVALEAVVTREGNAGSAILVTSTLAFGFSAGAFKFFIQPYLHDFRALSGRAFALALALSCLVSAVLIFTFLKADVGTRILWKEVARNPNPDLSEQEFDRLWVKHLIATSDYRIDKLGEEAERGGRATDRAAMHMKIQKGVQAQECEALESLIEGEGSEEKQSALLRPCYE